jgi:hypothetical protein
MIVLESHGYRWEDNIKIELKALRYVDVYWIQLAQYKISWQGLLNTVIKRRVPQRTDNFLTSLAAVSFLLRNLLCGIN